MAKKRVWLPDGQPTPQGYRDSQNQTALGQDEQLETYSSPPGVQQAPISQPAPGYKNIPNPLGGQDLAVKEDSPSILNPMNLSTSAQLLSGLGLYGVGNRMVRGVQEGGIGKWGGAGREVYNTFAPAFLKPLKPQTATPNVPAPTANVPPAPSSPIPTGGSPVSDLEAALKAAPVNTGAPPERLALPAPARTTPPPIPPRPGVSFGDMNVGYASPPTGLDTPMVSRPSVFGASSQELLDAPIHTTAPPNALSKALSGSSAEGRAAIKSLSGGMPTPPLLSSEVVDVGTHGMSAPVYSENALSKALSGSSAEGRAAIKSLSGGPLKNTVARRVLSKAAPKLLGGLLAGIASGPGSAIADTLINPTQFGDATVPTSEINDWYREQQIRSNDPLYRSLRPSDIRWKDAEAAEVARLKAETDAIRAQRHDYLDKERQSAADRATPRMNWAR
jgi:hypothetical protein